MDDGSMKEDSIDAFELLIERTCHMQMEAFAAILQMTEDPDIENVIKSNITEVLKGGFDFHQHTERLARILFHTANLTKNAEFTATAGFYLYQYTLVVMIGYDGYDHKIMRYFIRYKLLILERGQSAIRCVGEGISQAGCETQWNNNQGIVKRFQPDSTGTESFKHKPQPSLLYAFTPAFRGVIEKIIVKELSMQYFPPMQQIA
eukprot:jgi/Bigna1/84284/fgenesh1_pg.128_\